MVSQKIQESKQCGTRPRRALSLHMDCELYPKGSERPEERHGLLFILEKSLWLCCGRKGLGMVEVRMRGLP